MGNNTKEKNNEENKKINDWLKKEFEKEKNILDKFNNNEIIRIERKMKGKKHYYFNISGFFDPDRGFIKALLDIYKRYDDILSQDIKDIMPFGCLILQPYDKIVEFLKIRPGGKLDYSLGIIYSFITGIGLGTLFSFIIARVNLPLGCAITGIYILVSIYEIYKCEREENKIKNIKIQHDIFITKILKLFGESFSNGITSDNNVIEIIIDEKYENLLVGLILGIIYKGKENKEKVKVIINFRNIPGLKNAKRFNELSQREQEIYSDIIESMKKSENDDSFYHIYNKLGMKYRETFQICKKKNELNLKLNQKNKELEDKNKELLEQMNEKDEELKNLKEMLKIKIEGKVFLKELKENRDFKDTDSLVTFDTFDEENKSLK